MAPEVVNRKGHGTAADWWSYGVLMVRTLYYFYELQKVLSSSCVGNCAIRFVKRSKNTPLATNIVAYFRATNFICDFSLKC